MSKKVSPRAIRSNYKGVMLTIDEFILLPECELGRVSVALKLREGMTFAEIIKAGNKTSRKTILHPYKDITISVDDFTKLPICTIPKNSVHARLRKGMTLDEIAKNIKDIKPVKRRGKNKAAIPKDKVVISRKQEKINANKAIVARNKAIMAVPQNPITTQEFYMKKSHIRTPDVEPTVLSSNGWMGRP